MTQLDSPLDRGEIPISLVGQPKQMQDCPDMLAEHDLLSCEARGQLKQQWPEHIGIQPADQHLPNAELGLHGCATTSPT